ncbi:MAG: hypothetical protein K2N82_05645, partial [Lachnospiraceae bacterium]|nr:hypothetical protein [Lachnospiraceae bacterium]
MRFPFFASFIVFCIWLGYEIHKHRNMDAKISEEFWAREAAANNTRKKSLENLDYIRIPFDALPMDILPEHSVIKDCQETLKGLSTEPVVNLTGITNTDLKLQYGAPNIELLSQYDQRYTLLARTLQTWAETLHKEGYPDDAAAVLEFAVKTRTDVSASYKLLASIYQDKGQPDKIRALIPVAESLNSPLKNSIVRALQGLCQ